LLLVKLDRLMGALVPPPYRSFSALELGQVNTSDVMSWVRRSMKRAAVTSLSFGRAVPAAPMKGSVPSFLVSQVADWVTAAAAATVRG
jgi:hypothetical protein